MLLKCPECELQVSDKALTCPHCGYPLVSGVTAHRRQSNKRMRLPNGFGQITEIKSKNLRKPFRAMITVGKTKEGRPISKLLKPEAYFETYNDAYAALVEYNKNPYDIDEFVTFEELYNKWSTNYFKDVTESSARTIRAAWVYCVELYGMPVKEIRARHLKGCIENSKASANTKSRMKSVFNLMFDYALEYELADKNYARTFNLSNDVIKEQEKEYRGHHIYTDEEMEILWANLDVPYVNIILYQCYSGWRPQELGLIKVSDVDLDNGLVVGGMKTEAGKNRTVPIHSKVKAIVEKAYRESVSVGSEYLFTCEGDKLTYDKYNKRYVKVKEQLDLSTEHKPHDGRKQFITQCKKYKVDDYAIKRMVGHAISDITEAVYTERGIEWLKEEIEKI